MARSNKLAPKAKVRAVAQSIEALELRKAGLAFNKIASRLGISVASAHRRVVDAMAESVRERNMKAADLVQIEIERLDAALLAIWPGVIQGDVAKIGLMLKISESRRKLLGLDAPTRLEASGPDGGPITVDGSDPAKVFVFGLLERYATKAAAIIEES